jgi:hypothetical protein
MLWRWKWRCGVSEYYRQRARALGSVYTAEDQGVEWLEAGSRMVIVVNPRQRGVSLLWSSSTSALLRTRRGVDLFTF